MLTFDEARLLKMFKQLSRDDDRQDILDYLECKLARQELRAAGIQSGGTAARAEVMDEGAALAYFEKQYGGFSSQHERALVQGAAAAVTLGEFYEAVDRTKKYCNSRGAVARYLIQVVRSMNDDSEGLQSIGEVVSKVQRRAAAHGQNEAVQIFKGGSDDN